MTKPRSKSSLRSERKQEPIVRLRIICLGPPDPERFSAEFGLQDNSTTSDWLIHSGKKQANGDIRFECECRVRTGTGSPNFLGEFVHGPPAKRFLYLSWKPKDWRPGQEERIQTPTSCWVRRMKIHLGGITRALIKEATQPNRLLQTSVAGTANDGGPNCASVPLIGGWRVIAAAGTLISH